MGPKERTWKRHNGANDEKEEGRDAGDDDEQDDEDDDDDDDDDDEQQDDLNWACDRAGSTAPLMWRLSGKVNYRMTEMKMMEIIIYTYKQENRHPIDC